MRQGGLADGFVGLAERVRCGSSNFAQLLLDPCPARSKGVSLSPESAIFIRSLPERVH